MERGRTRLIGWTLAAAAAIGLGAYFAIAPGGGSSDGDASKAHEPSADATVGGNSARPSLAAAEARGGAPGTRAGRSTIAGTVRRGGTAQAARVEVFLQGETDAHPHAAYYRVSRAERDLAAPVESARPVAQASAAADGRFEIAGIAPGRYEVQAVAADGATGAVAAAVEADGQRREVSIRLQKGTERLAGRIGRAGGAPFHGIVQVTAAAVAYDGRDDDEFHGARASTDAAGRFAVDGLPAGWTVVTAIAPGELRISLPPLLLPHAGDVSFVVDEGGAIREGKVIDAESSAPITGAEVFWEFYGTGGGSAGRVVSDAGGSFTIHSPGAISELRVRAQGFAPMLFRGYPEPIPTTARLHKGARLFGRVTSAADGKPVAGITVSVQEASHDPETTDADGRYAAEDLAPGEAKAYARGDGWVPQGLAPRGFFHDWDRAKRLDPFVVVLEPGKTTTADFVVEPGVEAHGVVLDSDGKPVAGAAVSVESGEDPALEWTGSELPPLAASAADGRWTIRSLIADAKYEFSTRTAGTSRVQVKDLKGTPTSPISVELRLPAPTWVVVLVLDDETGKPIVGARMSAMIDTAPGCSSADGRNWTTGEDGKALVGPMGPETGDVSVGADGYIERSQQPYGTPSEKTGDAAITVRLRAARVIEGVVRFPDGTPAAGAEVTVKCTSSDMWDTYVTRLTCGADGRFVAEYVANLSYSLHAEIVKDGKGFTADADARGGAKDVVIVLVDRGAGTASEPPRGPEGAPTTSEESKPWKPVHRVLVHGADGKPIPRADTGMYGSIEDGEWKPSSNLYMGELPVTLEILRPRTEYGALLPFGPASVTIDWWKKGETVVTLPPDRPIDGVVRGPDGKGVPRVLVTAVPAKMAEEDEYHWESIDRGSSRTDADGAFHVATLGDEEYALRFLLPDGLHPPLKPVLVRGGASGVVVALRAGVDVRVTVLDSRDRPVVDAVVSVNVREWRNTIGSGPFKAAVPVVLEKTGADGRALLPGLDPVRAYELAVSPPASRSDLRDEDLEAWVAKDEVVRIPVRASLFCRVVDAAGRPVARASVFCSGRDRRRSARTDDDGRAEWKDVEEGEHVLSAAWDNQGDPEPGAPTVVATTGGGEVLLTLAPAAALTVRVGNMPEKTPWNPEARAWREGDPASAAHFAPIVGGIAQFRGMQAEAKYTVWVRLNGESGLTGILRHVSAADADVIIRLAEGARIRGTTSPLVDRDRGGVVACGERREMRATANIGEDGTYEIRGLIEGVWSVEASASVKGRAFKASAMAPAGGTLDLTLQPK